MPALPACLRCHRRGGAAVDFLFAGTVSSDTAASRGAPVIEIRIVDAKGNATSTRSDVDGNFWVKSGAAFPKEAKATVRTADHARDMRAPVSNGDCNECHTTEKPLVL
jgi:hypothetical protein